MSSKPPACGNCDEPMHELRLAGHYGSTVTLDRCRDCDLLWFDDVETARLSGTGMLELIGAMAVAQGVPHRRLRPQITCVRCQSPVRSVHNRSRWGASSQLACAQRHGAYQSYAQFLAEKGLTSPMTSADRTRLLQRDGAIHCINCGAQIDAGASRCGWCESTPAVNDVARLAASLDPEEAIGRHDVHATPLHKSALGCPPQRLAVCRSSVRPSARLSRAAAEPACVMAMLVSGHRGWAGTPLA